INYPSVEVIGNSNTVEQLYLIPRVIMGIFAVADTFLMYRITEYSYGRNVSIVASVLFAVMPFTWLTRRIFLESIQLPFILTSILLILNLGRGHQQILSTQQRLQPQTQPEKNKPVADHQFQYAKFTLIIS